MTGDLGRGLATVDVVGGAALWDGAVEQAARCRHPQQRAHAHATGRLAEDRHVVGVATEGRNALLDPLECGDRRVGQRPAIRSDPRQRQQPPLGIELDPGLGRIVRQGEAAGRPTIRTSECLCARVVQRCERTAELGLRKALGATPGRIRAEVMTETLLLCLLGGGVGVGLGSASIAALGPLRFAEGASLVPRTDAALLAVAFGILLVTALLAGLPAANRAARLDPVAALRDA